MEKVVSRMAVKDMLTKWVRGEVLAKDIHAWSESRYMNTEIDFEDWEKDDMSVTNQALGELDMLDMNLVTVEDAPALSAFLETPYGDFAEGYAKLENYQRSIDLSSRRQRLAGDPFYEKYCS